MSLNIIRKTAETIQYKNPLLFIHGMWQGSWVWEEYFMDYFANKGYDCIAINLRGHNGSPAVGWFRFTRIKHYLEDLHSVIEGLETPPILIGHSMGGFLIQKYLTKYRMPGGVLVASVPPSGMFRPTIKSLKNYPLSFLWGSLTFNTWPMMNSIEKRKKIFFTPDIHDSDLQKYSPQFGNESYFAYLGMLLFRVNTKKIETPLTVIGGAEDWAISPKMVQSTADAYGVEAKIFPKMGHCPMLDPQWKDVADYIFENIKDIK